MTATTRRSDRGGFCLLEAAVATAVVALALTALLAAVGPNTRVNDAGRKIAQGPFLLPEIRDPTLALPFGGPDPADVQNPPGPDGPGPQAFVDDLGDRPGALRCSRCLKTG
jgi:hypothetical protein